jgi:hypothetical protein
VATKRKNVMIYSEINYCGTLRITNPNTLQRWIDKGLFKKKVENGFLVTPEYVPVQSKVTSVKPDTS